MSDHDRIDRLEERVATLETLLRRVLAERSTVGATPPAAPAAPAAPTAPPPEATRTRPAASPRPLPRPGAAGPQPPRARRAVGVGLVSEEWIGQRGLLAVGVTAMILAAGYLLKLSFDRGWISPLMRCIGGATAGITIGAIGWRLEPKYRTYGAALVGCGAAIIYLAVWAASGRYQFLPATPGIGALALVSLGLAAIAYALDAEALGATAALGAFFAPLMIETSTRDADVLLIYLACMGVALGWVAGRKRWRLATLVIAASVFGLGLVGAGEAAPHWALAYGVVGGTGGLFLGLRERWWETRGLAFGGGWAIIETASDRMPTAAQLPVLFAALVMAAPVWWYGFRSPRIFPTGVTPRLRGAEWSTGEALYFFATPFLVGWAIHQQNPALFDARAGLVALIVGLPYVVAGYARPRPAFALVGATALGVAAWLHWPGTGAVWALAILALLWAALDHALERTDGRWYALALSAGALLHLLGNDLPARGDADPAFNGRWAMALWGLAAATAILARGLWKPGGAEEMRRPLWFATGLMVLFGVTGEIGRYFTQRGMEPGAAALAGGLAVSAWWLAFAAALVVAGFARGIKPVRVAGLTVAGLALIKVSLFDLSSLDALYRVASVFFLACVSLALAYLYHRRESRLSFAGRSKESL